MAKTDLNIAFNGLSGRSGRLVYRRVGDKTVICSRPRFTQPPSPAQTAVRDRFRLAAAYATEMLADPVQRAAYEAIALAKNLPVRRVMMSDYLRSPSVHAIELAGYRGAIGDPIAVLAVDDVEVTAVSVTIRAADQSLLEQGAAALIAGKWLYHATTVRIAGNTVTIIATATDRPGNTGSKTESWTY